MLAIKRSAGVASGVNLKNPLPADEKESKRRVHPSFETQDRRHQMSKKRYQRVLQIFFSKKITLVWNSLKDQREQLPCLKHLPFTSKDHIFLLWCCLFVSTDTSYMI